MEKIWWEHITKANYFIRSVTDALQADKSVILSMPRFVPWRNTFQELTEEILRRNPDNSLVYLDCPEDPPGKYLLEHYCKKEKRDAYRYGMSYAEFLAKSRDIVLHNRYLWIKNLSRESLHEWIRFISEYYNYLEKDMSPALFILETTELPANEKNLKNIAEIRFTNMIQDYDIFTFCILLSSDMSVHSADKSYLAELVSSICGNDVELCAKSISCGKQFLKNPAETLHTIMQSECHSDGSPFTEIPDDKTIEIKIWESQIKMLFPIIERYRSRFVSQHYDQILAALPITNNLGDKIESPEDAELGVLIQLVGKKNFFLGEADYKELNLFRNARNDLAHLRPLGYDISEQILHKHC